MAANTAKGAEKKDTRTITNVKKKNGRVSVLKNCGRSRRKSRSGAESPHSRWKLRRIWSADGSKERGKCLACAAGYFFFMS